MRSDRALFYLVTVACGVTLHLIVAAAGGFRCAACARVLDAGGGRCVRRCWTRIALCIHRLFETACGIVLSVATAVGCDRALACAMCSFPSSSSGGACCATFAGRTAARDLAGSSRAVGNALYGLQGLKAQRRGVWRFSQGTRDLTMARGYPEQECMGVRVRVRWSLSRACLVRVLICPITKDCGAVQPHHIHCVCDKTVWQQK